MAKHVLMRTVYYDKALTLETAKKLYSLSHDKKEILRCVGLDYIIEDYMAVESDKTHIHNGTLYLSNS